MSGHPIIRLTYPSLALPLANNDYILFSSRLLRQGYAKPSTGFVHGDLGAGTTGFSTKGMLAGLGARWIRYNILTSHAGTIVPYMASSDPNPGATAAAGGWRAMGSGDSITGGAAAAGEFNIEGLENFELRFENGATTQTEFEIHLALSSDRADSTP